MLVLVPPPSDFPVKLRPASEADIEAIAEIKAEAYWSNFNDLEPGSHQHPGYKELAFASDLADAKTDWPTATVAELNGKPVGVCYLEFKPALLSGLWVLPEMHGKGIGRFAYGRSLGAFRKAR